METLETLKKRIDSGEDMSSVVSAMKVLAIVSIRQFEKAEQSLSGYARAIELGFQVALKNRPEGIDVAGPAPRHSRGGATRSCAVIFGSRQGLAGQFNERIASFAATALDAADGDSRDLVIALGDHLPYRLGAVGIPADEAFPLPASLDGVKRSSSELLARLSQLRHSQDIDRIVLFHHKNLSGAAFEPRMQYLFPVDKGWLAELEARKWDSRTLPAFTMEWRELFSSLVREYFMVMLQRSFVESLFSENSSRLMAMQAAERNIAGYLEELNHDYNNLRQGSITSEIMDIVASFEVLT